MAARKTERLLNLLIMLLVQRHYVPKERIRQILYADQSSEAFERMFERDKDELRALGVPIEVGNLDSYFDDEQGYRVRPDDFQLPEIEFDAEESAVLGLAARVWQHARLAGATSDALSKLQAAGIQTDQSALDVVGPAVAADDPSFDVFWEAARQRIPVTFGYRRSGSDEVTSRHLQPWGVVRYAGRWYAVGMDTDRGEQRIFRLSRIAAEATYDGDPGSYEIPPGTNIREITRMLAPAPATHTATLLVRPGHGHGLRKHATGQAVDAQGPDGTGWERLEVRYSSATMFADEVLSYGADVYVEEPAEVREAVVARLNDVIGEAS